MELYVLDPEFNTIGIVDSYTSLIWTKRYFEFGDCEVYIKANAENLNTLKCGHWLVRSDDDMICRIERVQLSTDTEEGNYIVVTGTDARSILAQRIVWTQTNFTGTVENFIRKLITDAIINPTITARRIDNFTLGNAKGFTDTIEQQVTYDALDEKIIEISKAYGYGTRVTFDGTNFVFDIYKGKDRSYNQDINDYVTFSPDFDNIISSEYVADSSEYKNVALVGGEGEGNARRILALGTASGLNRRELFVDAGSVSSETAEGETIDYDQALKNEGVEALAEHGITQAFDGEVESNLSYIYNRDYYLGDIVQIRNEYGIELPARITEVIESWDSSGYSVIPTFESVEVVSDDGTMRIL